MHGDTADMAQQRRAAAWARLALVAAGVAFAYGLLRLLFHARSALGYRYGLDYGEGVVWQQMHGIVAGHGYAPLRLLPAFVYEYPPLYHLLTYAVASLGGLDELFAGRLVSLAAMLLSAALVGWLSASALGSEDRRVRISAGLFAGLVFATLPVTLAWSLLMRVDMVGCALTLAGLLLSARAARTPIWAIAAGLTFTAALYARQTCLPAPAAAFVVLWIVRPRTAWLLAVSAVASGLVALVAVGGRDFLLHILFYNINPIVWEHGHRLAMVLSTTAVTLALGAAGAAAGLRRLRARGPAPLRTRLRGDRQLVVIALLLLTLSFKTVMLPAILKTAASDNYLIDWFAPLAALAGVAAAPAIRSAWGRGAPASALLLILIALGLPAGMLDPPLRPDVAATARATAANDAVVARIRASAKPVVAEEDMTVLLRAGQPIVWEPAIIAELGSAGVYDDRALARRVRRGDFGFFITNGRRGETLYDQRFTPVLDQAIQAAYPRQEQVGSLTLHLPA